MSAGIQVRMYRQGLGDCFLVTLPKTDGGLFRVMIDCGVVIGTPDASAGMRAVVEDIARTTGGHVDLLAATHEHWDHLSGFVQARDAFEKIRFDNVWLAWTEHPTDELASQLRGEHQALRVALASAAARLHFGTGTDGVLDNMLEFFGAAGQGTTADAMRVVKGLHADPRFCYPTDPPVEFPGVAARFYVLGPPHDLKAIKRYNPSKAHPETYGLAQLYLGTAAPQILDANLNAPFDPIVRVPFEAAAQMPFFQKHYWGEAPGGPTGSDQETDQSWRRIDGNWLDSSSSLALQLDAATNNTSLVLAIELPDQRVLLFPADAQVGNWLSWQDLSWPVEGRNVTGPDLLRRTALYKVGHHGSHNATLREKGLEMMENLALALIPVDHDMAVKKKWDKMPLGDIETILNAKTGGRVLRIDRPVPEAVKNDVTEGPEGLYYEISL